jgi:flagellar biosynthesis/type III secretory pathway chaperone
MTPHEMTQTLVAAGKSLIAVLDEESAALTEVRLSRVAELCEAKETAAAHYESIFKTASGNAELVAAADAADRHALSAVKSDLDRAAVRNVNALRAAMEMNRRLMQTIATSIERQRLSASGYTKTGAAYQRAHAPKAGDTLSVSLNKTF